MFRNPGINETVIFHREGGEYKARVFQEGNNYLCALSFINKEDKVENLLNIPYKELAPENSPYWEWENK